MAAPVLFVCHQFLPRAVAGTELHTWHLGRHLSRDRRVGVFFALLDPTLPHGSLIRGQLGPFLTFAVVQNFASRALVAGRDAQVEVAFDQVLQEFSPQVVHFHHLAHLSLELPVRARQVGCRVVMTLHDYYLTCPSGGQRVAHPDGQGCERSELSRCRDCLSHYHQREGRITQGVRSLVEHLSGGISAAPLGRLYRRLPMRLKSLIRQWDSPPPPEGLPLSVISSRREQVARIWASCEVIVAPSQHVVSYFGQEGLGGVQLLPNGAPDPWARAGEEIHSQVGHEPPPPVRLMYVGTLAPHKGIDLVVDATRELDPSRVRVDIYGDVGMFPLYMAPLLKRAGPCLHFRGPLPPERVAQELRLSHALVLAARWPENAPLSVLEARAQGLPVIAPHIGGLPEGIQSGVDGLLYPPGELATLREVITRFVDDGALRTHLRAGVRPPLTAAAHARQVSEMYESLGVR